MCFTLFDGFVWFTCIKFVWFTWFVDLCNHFTWSESFVFHLTQGIIVIHLIRDPCDPCKSYNLCDFYDPFYSFDPCDSCDPCDPSDPLDARCGSRARRRASHRSRRGWLSVPLRHLSEYVRAEVLRKTNAEDLWIFCIYLSKMYLNSRHIVRSCHIWQLICFHLIITKLYINRLYYLGSLNCSLQNRWQLCLMMK